MPPADVRRLRRGRDLGKLAVLAALGAALAVTSLLSDRFDARRRAEPRDRILYLPRGNSLEYMSLGYRGLAADMVWLRSILYLGGKLRHSDTNYEWLGRLCDVTTDLDPHWVRPYQAGGILLSALPQDDNLALALLRRGINRNPDNWNIPYQAAQLQLLRGRRLESLKYLRLVDRLPGRPDTVPGLIVALHAEGGDYRNAVRAATIALADTDDRFFRQVRARGYREALARLLEHELTAAAAEFSRRTGRAPRDVPELLAVPGMRNLVAGRLAPWLGPEGQPGTDLAGGIAARLPADPLGMDFYLRPDGTVHSRGIERLELRRLVCMLNPYLSGFGKRRGRPPLDVAEFEAYLGSIQLGTGAQAVFGRPPQLPEHPLGSYAWTGVSDCSWGAMLDPISGQLQLPPGLGPNEMYSAPLDMPPGPAERAAAEGK